VIHRENPTAGQHGLALREPKERANLRSLPRPAGQVAFAGGREARVFISARAVAVRRKEREGISQLFGEGLCIMPFESVLFVWW